MDWLSASPSNTREHWDPFTDPQMLQAFLSVTVLLLPATRIAIEVRCGAKRSEKPHGGGSSYAIA